MHTLIVAEPSRLFMLTDYLVTPICFDVKVCAQRARLTREVMWGHRVRLRCSARDMTSHASTDRRVRCRLVYTKTLTLGLTGHELADANSVLEINSIFPSQKRNNTETKGGVVLVRLERRQGAVFSGKRSCDRSAVQCVTAALRKRSGDRKADLHRPPRQLGRGENAD